jgi:hypothetical protein
MNILTKYYGFKIIAWVLLFFPAYYFINDYKLYYIFEALYFNGVPTVGTVESKIRDISADFVLYNVSYITESGQKYIKAIKYFKTYQKVSTVDIVYFAEAPQFAEAKFSFENYKFFRTGTYNNSSILIFFLMFSAICYYYCRKYVLA